MCKYDIVFGEYPVVGYGAGYPQESFQKGNLKIYEL